MLDSGLVEEVTQLRRSGDASGVARRAIGYRLVHDYLEGELCYYEMRSRIVAATRQLAKRQLTWLRNTAGYVWFDASDTNVQITVKNYLECRLAHHVDVVWRK